MGELEALGSARAALLGEKVLEHQGVQVGLQSRFVELHWENRAQDIDGERLPDYSRDLHQEQTRAK